jgi:hypothetical protein
MKPIPEKAKIGVVIGTYGSVPYCDLSVVCIGEQDGVRHILIHDDGSSEFEALKSVVSSDFMHIWHHTTGKRLGSEGHRMLGDISAFVVGIDWANANGFDLLVKFSRRWIVNRPWVDGLQELAHNTQYATYSATDTLNGLGFRSECCALHVPSWIESGAYAKMKAQVDSGVQPTYCAEGWYHELARQVHIWRNDSVHRNDLLALSESLFKRSREWICYGLWPMMGLSREQRLPGIYWHNSRTPAEYAALAQEFGLPYTESDFVLPEGTY